MSGGLTPCRQLRPSSRRELVSASNSHVMEAGGGGGKEGGREVGDFHITHLELVLIFTHILHFVCTKSDTIHLKNTT